MSVTPTARNFAHHVDEEHCDNGLSFQHPTGRENTMGITAGIWLALLGVLAIPNLIIAKKPEAKELIAKLAPYQGWIGAVSAIWGLWIVIHSFLNFGWLTSAPIWWATYLTDGVVQFGLGMLLGVGTLKTFIKAPAAQAKMDEVTQKLAPKQGVLGLVALGLAIWVVACNILFF